jgi:hypothetical protein
LLESLLVAYRSRHCSHFNDGFTSTVAASQQFSMVTAICIEISFLPDCMVCGGIFFIPTLLKKS